MNRRVLCVDDNPNVLQAYRRNLRTQFDLEIADSGAAGLQAIRNCGPYAVTVSDMRMPGMDGVQFLSEVREIAPETVRIMLTGEAGQQTAIDAVNRGAIFRFLNKPCEVADFTAAIEAGVEQHRLITAEKELLSKTLGGSVSLLTEVLALASPLAFGRSGRVRQLVRQIAELLQISNMLEVEFAAMLSQVGCVTVPEPVLLKLSRGQQLAGEDELIFNSHPEVGARLIGRIPRFEAVSEIIRYQEKRFDGSGVPNDNRVGDRIPLTARILKVVLDYDTLKTARRCNETALQEIRGRRGWYDPNVIDALASVLNCHHEIFDVTVAELEDGMIFDEHVLTLDGSVLVARDEEVRSITRERLSTYVQTARGVRQPIRVRRPVNPLTATRSPETTNLAGQPTAMAAK